MNSGMSANQSGADSVILLAGDNPELLSPFDGFVKKIKFTTTYNDINRGSTIILATGHINTDNNNIYYETDTTTILETIRPSYTYEFDVNLTIKSGDQVFVGYNTGPNNADRFNVVGMNTYLADASYYWSVSRTTGNIYRDYQYYGPFYVESLVEKGDLEDVTNVQIALDNINDNILQIQTDISNIQPEEVTKFVDFRDSNRITYRMGNKSTETEIGGYITATDRNSRYKGGIILNGYLPRLFYENHNDLVLPVDPFRCLFEIHGDGAYISHTFPDITWVRLLEETSQSGEVYSLNNDVYLIINLAKFVGKSVNILIQYNILNSIAAGTDIMSCTNIPLFPYDFLKDGLIFKNTGILTTKNKMDPDTYTFTFSYIV